MAQMGMDVEAVESIGRQLKQSASSVDQIVSTLDRTVNGLPSLWEGPDAQRFLQSWPAFRKSLVAAQASVAGLGQSALNNASEQRQASGSSGSGASASASAAAGATLPPALAYLASHSPGQILSDSDELLNTKLGPFEVGSLAKVLIPGAGDVTDTLDIASKISNGQVPWSESIGVAAGAMQDAAWRDPALLATPEYWGPTAAKVWLDAADQASKADFGAQQLQTNGNFILSNPGDAAAAAGEAVVGWVPNLLDDFGLKL